MRTSPALALLLSIARTAAAGELPTATCAISFTGTSSLHDFGGTVPPITTQLEPSMTSPGKWNADLAVPVAGMNTSNESRDAKMRDMLDAGHFPEIRVSLREIDPLAVRQTSELTGTLTIAGVTRDFVAKLTDWREDGSDVAFDLAATISLASFGRTAPSVLGLIRVADEVGISAHVAVDRAESQPPPDQGRR